MLVIKLPEEELYDSETGKFTKSKPITVKLEHSLISISRWESIWERPFIPKHKDDTKSTEELLSYIECMMINEYPDYVLSILWDRFGPTIEEYMNSKSTATIVRDNGKETRSKEFVSSELIYYWMIQFGIPMACEKWHLNRLLTLIKLSNAKQNPGKLTPKQASQRNWALNRQRSG